MSAIKSKVIMSSDSNQGYTLTAEWYVDEDGTVSPLRFELETFGDGITLDAGRLKKFKKAMKRAKKKHLSNRQSDAMPLS